MHKVIATHAFAFAVRAVGCIPVEIIRVAQVFGVDALVASALVAADAPNVAWAQQSVPAKIQPVSRPFPFVQIQIGDVPVALPKDWIETKFIDILAGKRTRIAILNANLRQPPRSTHFDVPPLALFDATSIPAAVVEQNLRSTKIALEKRWPERMADDDGFWRWKPREYVLINSTHARPLDQPLIVSCLPSVRPNRKGEQRCGVLLFTSELFVRYQFFDTDVPKSQWVKLDQRVLALVDFLDGRKAWTADK